MSALLHGMNTFEHWLLTFTAAALLIAPICAQTSERKATLTGGGVGGNDGGKCTIEVYVDGSADVEISGDHGFLRTLSGQPAQWRRFECSGPIPANPGEFRFSGVDGRGKQELVQDPSHGRGAAIVRIQDPDGGAEGYTFDLVWRGAGLVPGPTGQQPGGRDRRDSPNGAAPRPTGQQPAGRDRGDSTNSAARACQDAVKERANLQYGFRDIDFRGADADLNASRDDRITGSFEVPHGRYHDTYRFSCTVDSADGRIRGVEISQGRDAATADRYAGHDDAIAACQRAAEQRMDRDGYRNVQFGSLNVDRQRNDQISGTAKAQLGNNGRVYDFVIGCSFNPDNGNVRSVEATRR